MLRVVKSVCVLFLLLCVIPVQAASLNVGIILLDVSNPFFTVLAEEITHKLQASAKQPVNVLLHSSAYDLHKQNQQIHDCIKNNVDLLFIVASESDAIAPSVQFAREKGIIVVAVDVESKGANINVTTDNVQAGFVSCRYLAQSLPNNGKVAIINGSPISSVRNRVLGCRKALSQFPDIQLVSATHNGSGSFSGGLESMTYLLLEYPDLDGVFAINDLTAFGAAEAVTQQGNNDIVITSVDGSPDFLHYIQNNTTPLIASAAQFPYVIARKAVDFALKQLKHKSEIVINEKIPTRLMTHDNVDTFSYWKDLNQ